MPTASQLPRHTVCSLDRGLYAFRYVRASDVVPPTAELHVLSGSIEFVHAPGREHARLSEPGTSVVLVVRQSATIRVELTAGKPGADVGAEFGLDLLDRGELDTLTSVNVSGQFVSEQGLQQGASIVDISSMRIEAHVSRLGDVAVRSGDWIAGPQAPLPIEGLRIICSGGSASLGVSVQLRFLNGGQSWSAWHSPETFAGTRQQAQALNGLRLKLVGSRANQYSLIGEALFLGAPVESQRGDVIEFLGSDPLVGLKVALAPANNGSESASLRGPDRVRVYKAR